MQKYFVMWIIDVYILCAQSDMNLLWHNLVCTAFLNILVILSLHQLFLKKLYFLSAKRYHNAKAFKERKQSW